MDGQIIRHATPFLGNVASIAGCCWVLLRVRRQGASHPIRVFPRLLASLSLADLLFHFGFGMDELLSFIAGGSARSAAGYCSVIVLWLRCFEFVSSFQAAYVALHFALQSFHCMPPLHVARGCVHACWTLGVWFALIDFFVNPWTYEEQEGLCLPAPATDYTSIVVLSVCFVTSCVSYMLVVCRSFRLSPDSVLQRALRSAAMYPNVFIVTYALLLLCFLKQSLFKNTFIAATAYTLQSCNGLLNACAHACQGRYSVAVERHHEPQSPPLCDVRAGRGADATACKVVEVGGEEIIEYFLTTHHSERSCESCLPY